MTNETPKRRRWLQFGLRTLLIAVLLLSLPMSWFAVKMDRARKQKVALENLRGVIGDAKYGWEDWGTQAPYPDEYPEWQRALLGDDFFCDVVGVCCGGDLTDADMKYVGWLHGLKWLYASGPEVTNRGAEHLKRLDHLEELLFESTQITDAGLKHLYGLSNLKTLHLYDAKVTPEGIKELQQALPDCEIEY